MKKIILLVSIITLFVACEDDDVKSNYTPEIFIPVNIYTTSEYPHSYKEVSLGYDSLLRLVEVEITRENKEAAQPYYYSKQKMQYNKDGKPEKLVTYFNYSKLLTELENEKKEYYDTCHYTYEGNRIYICKNSNDYIVEIDPEGFIQSYEMISMALEANSLKEGIGENSLSNVLLYDKKGNICKENSLDRNFIYSYDNLNGIFKNINIPQWLLNEEWGWHIEGKYNFKNNIIQAYNDEEETGWEIEIKYIRDFPSLIKAEYKNPKSIYKTYYETDIIYEKVK